MKRSLIQWVGLGLSLSYLSAPLHAQTGSTVSLEEVIVTAEKRTTDLQKTPISIVTLSGDELRKTGEVKLNEALRNVPSLQIQSTAQGGTMYIRGVGSNGDSNEVDLAVSVTIDGAYSGRSEALSTGLYDVGQIEVLRGPQGTIYGRNSTAGAVTISSANPELDQFGAKVNAQIGNYALYHLDSSVNVPVTDSFGLRFAGMREKRDGYFTNNGNSSDSIGGRAKMLFQPDADLRMLLTVDYTRRKGDDLTTVGVTGTPTQPQFLTGDPWWVDAVTFPANKIDHKFTSITGQLDFNLGWSKLTAIPSYANSYRYTYGGLITGIGGMGLNAQSYREKQYTAEVRLASPDDSAIQWVGGLYYLHSKNATEDALAGTTGITTAMGTGMTAGVTYQLYQNNQAGARPTTSAAVFGQISYPLTEKLNLLAGARYTKDEKSRAYRITSIAIPGYDSGAVLQDESFSQSTYRAGLEYDVNDASMMYATVSTGYKAGGFSRGFPIRTYKPEDLVSYELGSKNRFLDNSLQVNGSIYYYDYKDLQVDHTETVNYPIPQAYVPADVSYTFATGGQIANADTARVIGLEMEVDWLATANDRIKLTTTLSDSKLGNFDPALYEAELVATSGQQMASAPKFTAAPSYEHSWTVGSGRLSARLQTRYSSSYWADTRGRTRAGAWQDAYWRSDANVSYESDNDWNVGIWAKNLENKAQITQAFPSNRVFITDPRTYGLNVSASF